MEEQKYTMLDLEEYIRLGEPGQRERGEAWRVAIGLQQVDGLTPSSYLLDTARQHIDGEISISRAKELIDSYYKSVTHRNDIEANRTEEADKVSARITEILSEKTFTFSPAQLSSIHRRLFEGIYKHAGHFRDYNITKNEWVFNGESIYYASYETISDTLEYEMRTEREFSYANVPVDDAIRHLMRFCANIWQFHAFCEGNTRTSAVFMIEYLRSLGFNVLNDLFAQNSWYFRNALVRANYSNLQKGIAETTVFLERFFRSMLLGEEHSLRNRELHIDWKHTESPIIVQDKDIQTQSANSTLYNLSKCNNCTLEEVTVLRVIQANPTITQKEIAAKIGKSERTIKSLTVTLQEKGILKRVGSRRIGKWKIVIAFLLALFLNLSHLFAQSPNYNIGDVITNPDGSKGVVFWLAPDGSGGWMCALNDVSGTYQWSSQSVNISGFPALPTPNANWQGFATITADTAGYEHTQHLRAAGNANTYPAAYAVDFAHGWYLPAIGQLLKLYAQQATISAALVANGGSEISCTNHNHYWSSTYSTTSNAYHLYHPSGSWSTSSKSTAYYVRPVRSFCIQNSNMELSYQWNTGDTTDHITVNPDTTTTYQVVVTNDAGCSDTVDFTLYVNSPISQSFSETACGSYEWHGQTYTESGTYTYSHEDANGCEQVDTLHLTINHPDTVRFNETVCQGEPYTGHGFNIPADSTMTPHVITQMRHATSLQSGCDSCTILTLTVLSPVTQQFTASSCNSYIWNGTTYTASGDYQQVLTTHNGCDSTVTLHLTINHPSPQSFTETVCISHEWHGQTYTESGTYTYSHEDANGCTQVDTLHLTINNPVHQSHTEIACESYEWTDGNGQTYTESGIYTYSHEDANGCEQVDTLHLTINHPDTVRFNETVCQGEPYTGHGFNIPADSTMTPHVITQMRHATSLQSGCDSCTILTLTVLSPVTQQFTASSCNSYIWNGTTYTASGDYQQVLTTHNGCDSTVTLHLTINHPSHQAVTETACGSYEWHGQTYTESGTYTYNHEDAHGCTQVDTLHLTINNPVHQSHTEVACESYEWTDGNGQTYTESGTYTYVHTGANGCEQVDTLHLTINNPDTVRFSETVCQGEPYSGHGFNIPTDSTMTPHVITQTRHATSLQSGCDTIVILTLTVHPTYTINVDDLVCEGDAYDGNGFHIGADQTIGADMLSLSQTFVTINGCDSTINLQLQVVDTALEIISLAENFCENGSAELSAVSTLENYVWSTGEQTQNITVSQPGTYTVTASSDHCESTKGYIIERCKADLYLPNAITPSKVDGLNDYFSIDPYTQQIIGKFEIWIYDRWGELVFYSSDKSFKWNGEVNGKLYPNTMYSYRIRYTKNLGDQFTEKGTVTVL